MSNFAMPSNGDANKDLIPLTDNDGVQAVMGRDLHAFLEVKKKYSDWFKQMVGYGFEEGRDYVAQKREADVTSGFTPGGNRVDHIVSLDMAKEIAMIQRTERGKQARQYFIECEKRIKQVPDSVKEAIASMTRMEWLQVALNAEEERLALEAKNKELEPKADAYDSFIDTTGKYSVGIVAKMLGLGQNKLFRELRNRGVLISKGSKRNTPYQQYMHHFEVIAHEFEKNNGEMGCSYTTYVQPSGINFIRKKLGLTSIDPMPNV